MTPFEFLNSYLPVPHETFERLELYHDLLLKWQSKINLIGKDTIGEAWSRHFLDSLQLIKYIDDKNKVIADLGSGAGFPGMVLAICGYRNIHLIESDSRKVAFLREAARITKTEITIHNCRIEDYERMTDIFVSRACASIDKLLHLITKIVSCESIDANEKLVSMQIAFEKSDLPPRSERAGKACPKLFIKDYICLFHKGKNYSIENEEALKKWNYDMAAMPSIVDSQSVVLSLSNIHKRV